MATNPLTLYKGAGSSVTFSLQGVNGMKTSYINQSSTLSNPDSLAVNHRTKAPGAKGSDRHDVLKQLAVTDTNGNVGFVSSDYSLTVARNVAITDTLVVEQVAEFVSYFVGDLSSAQMTKLQGVVTDLIDGITP